MPRDATPPIRDILRCAAYFAHDEAEAFFHYTLPLHISPFSLMTAIAGYTAVMPAARPAITPYAAVFQGNDMPRKKMFIEPLRQTAARRRYATPIQLPFSQILRQPRSADDATTPAPATAILPMRLYAQYFAIAASADAIIDTLRHAEKVTLMPSLLIAIDTPISPLQRRRC
jgi:hypothetical protein